MHSNNTYFVGDIYNSIARHVMILSEQCSSDENSKDGCTGNQKLHLVETQVVEAMKNRLELTEAQRPPTPSHLTTLRVKTEDGEQVSSYVLMCV